MSNKSTIFAPKNTTYIIMKKQIFFLCTLFFAIVQGIWAQEISYVDRTWNGTEVVETPATCSSYTEIAGNEPSREQVLSSGWYVVKNNATRKRLIIGSQSKVNIIVCDGATLNSIITFNYSVMYESYLHIYGQSEGTGKIVADARNDSKNAGIGGNGSSSSNYDKMATLYVHGCQIEAHGGKYAAGVGGSFFLGSTYQWGKLYVYGGSIKAWGGKYAAGIGGGQDEDGIDVTVYDGTVWASGGTDAAGIGSGEQIGSYKHGGTLTVYGGTVYGSGEGWGAGIGGGEDSNGAQVKVYGGTVIAWAGKDAENKSGCAFGSEDGDGHRGSLNISEKMMVRAGQTSSSLSLFSTGERVPACFFRPYVVIETCTHPSGLTYTINDDGTHTSHCKHCALSETAAHFNSDGSGKCVCGYKDGEEYYTITIATSSDGKIYSGVGAIAKVGNNKPYTLPECSTIPVGYDFAGWVVNPTSQENGIEPNEGETLLAENSEYTVTQSINIFARYTPLNISLADASDNGETLYNYNGRTAARVTLTGRTIYKDGSWNTLCLPFEVSTTSEPLSGDGVIAMTLDTETSGFSNGTLTLNFSDVNGATIPAGTPFIIKWPKDNNNPTIVDPTFTNVSISNELNDQVCTIDDKMSITFKGTYGPVSFDQEGDNTVLYLGADNTLYYPSTNMSINSFRAFFKLNGLTAGEPTSTESGQQTIKAFHLNFGEEETGIKEVNGYGLGVMDDGSGWYTIDGRRLLDKPAAKGLYIHNGVKVLIK